MVGSEAWRCFQTFFQPLPDIEAWSFYDFLWGGETCRWLNPCSKNILEAQLHSIDEEAAKMKNKAAEDERWVMWDGSVPAFVAA